MPSEFCRKRRRDSKNREWVAPCCRRGHRSHHHRQRCGDLESDPCQKVEDENLKNLVLQLREHQSN
jgi:hypothetical protein